MSETTEIDEGKSTQITEPELGICIKNKSKDDQHVTLFSDEKKEDIEIERLSKLSVNIGDSYVDLINCVKKGTTFEIKSLEIFCIKGRNPCVETVQVLNFNKDGAEEKRTLYYLRANPWQFQNNQISTEFIPETKINAVTKLIVKVPAWTDWILFFNKISEVKHPKQWIDFPSVVRT